MRSSSGNNLNLAIAFVLLLVASACLAEFKCYVCDDCAKVTKETPLLACNEDFFNQGGSSEASTVTTTASTTISVTEDDVTSTETTTTMTTMTTTDDPSSSSTTSAPSSPTTTTTEESTTIQSGTESTESTEPPMPTPATPGPPETTTPTPQLPTPPAEDLNRQLQTNSTRLLPSFDIDVPSMTDLNVRQRRAVIDTSVTYHCYTVQKTLNNTVVTERGCSRVETMQSLCQELQTQNVGIPLSNCDPCSMSACNGVSSLMRSSLFATVLIAAVAAALQRN